MCLSGTKESGIKLGNQSRVIVLYNISQGMSSDKIIGSKIIRYSRYYFVDYFHLSVTIYYFYVNVKQARIPVFIEKNTKGIDSTVL